MLKFIKKLFTSDNTLNPQFIEVECIKCGALIEFTKGEVIAKKVPVCDLCFEKIKKRLSRRRETKSTKEADRYFQKPVMVFSRMFTFS